MTRTFGMAAALLSLSSSIAVAGTTDDMAKKFGAKWAVLRAIALYCNEVRPGPISQQAVAESETQLREVAQVTEPASEVDAGIDKSLNLASQFVAKPENRAVFMRDSQDGEKCEAVLPAVLGESRAAARNLMTTWREEHPAWDATTQSPVVNASGEEMIDLAHDEARLKPFRFYCAKGVARACFTVAAAEARARNASPLETLRSLCIAGHMLSCMQYNALKDGK